ncbi:hypothetical protein IFM89_032153 [Coptis chinensis]|uniref:Uncharacterized protein n=1 Tax=Coptis chinensis TaxID=261450 RepID=A0A835MGI0_9MAGN|nr:hypothetical protein IFM89_032153 [Coptis chinensis]
MKGANKYRVEYGGGLVSSHESSKVLRTTQLQMVANQLVYEVAESDETYQLMLKRLQALSLELKEIRKTNDGTKISVVDSCTVNENSQPAMDVSQVLLINPNISQTKGRKKEIKVYKSSTRIKGVIDEEIEDVDDHRDDDDDENRDGDEDNEDRDGDEVEFKI